MRLKEKVAIITGAGRGLGEAIAQRFVKEGAKVVIFDANEKSVNRVVKELTDAGGTVLGFTLNVAEYTEVNEAVERVLQEFGTVDILVNNAGITRDARAYKMTDEQWDEVISVNLKGPFNCCKAVIPTMSKNKYGKIVNVSSTTWWVGNPGQVNYCAAKSGLYGLTRTLARELGTKGINVNTVSPGAMATEMWEQVPEEIRTVLLSRVMLGRVGLSEESANAILFLSSDESSYITGQVLEVNGGV